MDYIVSNNINEIQSKLKTYKISSEYITDYIKNLSDDLKYDHPFDIVDALGKTNEMRMEIDDIIAKKNKLLSGGAEPMKEATYYDTLELKKDAPSDDIRKQYLKLAKEYHPNKHIGNVNFKSFENKFRAIATAFNMLSKYREDYDKLLDIPIAKINDFRRKYGVSGEGYDDIPPEKMETEDMKKFISDEIKKATEPPAPIALASSTPIPPAPPAPPVFPFATIPIFEPKPLSTMGTLLKMIITTYSRLIEYWNKQIDSKSPDNAVLNNIKDIFNELNIYDIDAGLFNSSEQDLLQKYMNFRDNCRIDIDNLNNNKYIPPKIYNCIAQFKIFMHKNADSGDFEEFYFDFMKPDRSPNIRGIINGKYMTLLRERGITNDFIRAQINFLNGLKQIKQNIAPASPASPASLASPAPPASPASPALPTSPALPASPASPAPPALPASHEMPSEKESIKESKKEEETSVLKPPPGIPNIGQTCYANSIFQLLYRITDLTNDIITNKFDKPEYYNSNSLAIKIFNFIKLMSKGDKISKEEARSILDICISKTKQEDANEQLGKVLFELRDKQNEIGTQNSRFITKLQQGDKDKNVMATNYILSLAVNKKTDKNSNETITDIINNNKLNISTGKYLIVHLKSYSEITDGTKIKFIPNIKLEETVHIPQKNDIMKLYNLVGVIIHIGENINSGHYIALIKYDKWYKYDDDTVSSISNPTDFLNNNKNSTPYILLYEEVSLEQKGGSYLPTINILSWNISWEATTKGLKKKTPGKDFDCGKNTPHPCIDNIKTILESYWNYDFIALQEASALATHQIDGMNRIVSQSEIEDIVLFYNKKYKLLAKYSTQFSKGRPIQVLFFDRGICVINIHAGHHPSNDFKQLQRTIEPAVIAKIQKSRIIIIAGDFNNDLKKYNMKFFGKTFYNKTLDNTCCYPPSGSRVKSVSDHILTSSPDAINSVIAISDYTSDHRPITTVLTISRFRQKGGANNYERFEYPVEVFNALKDEQKTEEYIAKRLEQYNPEKEYTRKRLLEFYAFAYIEKFLLKTGGVNNLWDSIVSKVNASELPFLIRYIDNLDGFDVKGDETEINAFVNRFNGAPNIDDKLDIIDEEIQKIKAKIPKPAPAPTTTTSVPKTFDDVIKNALNKYKDNKYVVQKYLELGIMRYVYFSDIIKDRFNTKVMNNFKRIMGDAWTPEYLEKILERTANIISEFDLYKDENNVIKLNYKDLYNILRRDLYISNANITSNVRYSLIRDVENELEKFKMIIFNDVITDAISKYKDNKYVVSKYLDDKIMRYVYFSDIIKDRFNTKVLYNFKRMMGDDWTPEYLEKILEKVANLISEFDLYKDENNNIKLNYKDLYNILQRDLYISNANITSNVRYSLIGDVENELEKFKIKITSGNAPPKSSVKPEKEAKPEKSNKPIKQFREGSISWSRQSNKPIPKIIESLSPKKEKKEEKKEEKAEIGQINEETQKKINEEKQKKINEEMQKKINEEKQQKELAKLEKEVEEKSPKEEKKPSAFGRLATTGLLESKTAIERFVKILSVIQFPDGYGDGKKATVQFLRKDFIKNFRDSDNKINYIHNMELDKTGYKRNKNRITKAETDFEFAKKKLLELLRK